MSNDAIVLLREDHQNIKRLFREFEGAGEKAFAAKQKIANEILELLTVHTYLENECMYPRTRELVPDLETDILESYEEHHVADVLSAELAAMSAEDTHFTPKMTVLMESVRHHISEEEDNWFPTVREQLGRKTLQEIGEEMVALRAKAPRHPAQPSALKKAIDAVLS